MEWGLIVALVALAFTIASFWWLHARTGRLEATAPRSYAFASLVRIRLPLAFFNTGAKELIVADLRLVLEGDPNRSGFEWSTTRTELRPQSEDGLAFPTPFSVQGRGAKELIVEFGDDLGWSPAPGTRHRMRVQALIHPSDAWVDVVAFDWWAPEEKQAMSSYLAHRNEPRDGAHTGAR